MINNQSTSDRNEIVLDDEDFKILKQFSLNKSGIVLPEDKKKFIFIRLSKLINQLHLHDFDSYFKLLQDNNEEEEKFFNLITNRNTDFFREMHHFEFLKNEILPTLNYQNRIRIWSAGCATGEEPYSIAMILDEGGLNAVRSDVKILATDINSASLTIATKGIYSNARLLHLDTIRKNKYFSPVKHDDAECFRIHQDIANFISFKRLNLMDTWPMHGPFDVIFFRNVAIYLEEHADQAVLKKMTNLLKPQGFLIIGHSENLGDSRQFFDLIGKSIYRKKV